VYICGEVQDVIFIVLLQTVFDKLDPEELRKARARSNPFETIRGGFFLNRAAMKMANMDRVFDFMFTKPKDEHDVSILVFILFVVKVITVQFEESCVRISHTRTHTHTHTHTQTHLFEEICL
jgi:hypothetical protein